jgi:hypothetical protein
MLDATRAAYGDNADSNLPSQETPGQWAAKVVRALERDDHVLGPGGALALGKLASRGPAVLLDVAARRFWSR